MEEGRWIYGERVAGRGSGFRGCSDYVGLRALGGAWDPRWLAFVSNLRTPRAKSMTPLRMRLIEYLQLRNYAPSTVLAYFKHAFWLARFYRRSRAELTEEQVRAYLVHLVQQKQISWSHYNVTVCTLRFQYQTTLGKTWSVRHVPFAKRPKKLPCVLSSDEVLSLLKCVPKLGHRVVMLTICATGLRISEATRLQPADIDSRRMVIIVRQGKGAKDRQVPLSPLLLVSLRVYWRSTRPKLWRFPGEDENQPVHRQTVAQA